METKMAHNLVHRSAALAALAASVVVLSSAPALAGVTPAGQSFNDIEFRLADDDALAAEQALAARLAPQGLDLKAARKALIEAGARFVGADAQGDLRFVYSTTEMKDDVLADVMVTVVVHHDGDVIRSVIVQREA